MDGGGGYSARNGARDAPLNRPASTGSTLGEDFPMLCETCLGPNPYVRMTKLPFGHKLCKISNLPYQAFRWKAGPTGRQKETIISISVAKERNICQTCLNDMKFGLPVGVRDSILKQEESTQIALPRSNVGQKYFYEQQAQLTESLSDTGTDMASELANVAPTRQLDKFSRMMQVSEAKSKVASRNLPKLCSFWLNGTCTRVLRKTCPFRPCCGIYMFPEIAGGGAESKKLSDNLIEMLNKDGPAAVQKKIDAETKTAIQQALKGNRDDAIRKRVTGEDDLTKKYLGRMKSMHMELEPPEDQSIVTLWLGNVDTEINEEDIRSVLYPFGFIVSISIVRSGRCAFVEYADRGTAEYAAGQMYNALLIKGYPISVNWAKPRTIALEGSSFQSSDARAVPLPPGMTKPPRPNSLPPHLLAFIPQGPDDDEAVGTKRHRVEDSEDQSSKVRAGEPPLPPSKPVNRYPSMNPSRMGAALS